MNDNINKKPNFLPPFRKFCMTVGELPSSYTETMTYYEMLLWFTKYLSETVIPAINNNAEALDELQKLFVQLQEYVNNYFENLDVQEEINNKLDEMAESGELAEIIGEYALKKVDYLEITNQTEAEIQEIFDIERAKVIEFKNDYTFTSTKILNRDTTLLLNGHTLTFNVPSVTENWRLSHGFFNFKPDDEFLAYNGHGNITILNGTIIGGNCSFIHGANINIKNIHFKNCQNDHIVELCAMNGVNIENCIFEGTPADGIDFKENIQLDNCTPANFPFFTDTENPTYDSTPTQNVLIKNNIFKKPSNVNYAFFVGIGMHGFEEGIYHTNIDVRNNQFIDMINMGLQLINSKHVNIENNIFRQASLPEGITGGMIRFRNENEDIKITKNEFDGNVRAIEQANYPILNKDFQITDNTLKNYTYSDATVPIIHIYNPLNVTINNNVFTSFSQNAIRLSKYGDIEDLTIFNTYIENNKFISDVRIDMFIVKTYIGNVYFNNNVFNISNMGYVQRCVTTTNDGNFIKMIAKGNTFSPNLLAWEQTIKDENTTTQYKEIYDLTVRGYSGNSTSLTNQALDVNYTHFNNMIITLGDGTHTQIFKYTNFSPYEKFDARTFSIPCVNPSNGNLDTATLVFNNDGTISYSSTGTPLRNIFFINV